MKEVIEIIEKLRTLSGNEQLDYLKSHKDNEVLKEVLQYTYDTNKIYNINEAKLDKALKSIITTADIKESDYTVINVNIWNEYKKSLDELASKKGVKEADVARLCNRFLIHREQKGKELLRGILLKDLRINMGVVSFNKVWKDFCFKFPYMGAKSFSMENLKKVKMPCIIQEKLDGMFCNAIVDPINNKVEYISRQGKPINIYGSMEEDLLKIKANQKFVLTGELLVMDKETGKPFSRQISNGIIKRDDKTLEQLAAIYITCWDFIPYDDFIKGVWKVPYEKRLGMLYQMSEMAGDKVKIVDTFTVNNIDEAMKLFNNMYSQGKEGIIVKENNVVWKNGKPSQVVKIKAELETDLLCYKLDEGTGNMQGMLGALKCKSGDNLLLVDVGTGFKESDRKEIWNNKDKYLNKIVTIKYNAKIKDKNKDTWSLFLPVFIEFRELDKDVADKLEDIK